MIRGLVNGIVYPWVGEIPYFRHFVWVRHSTDVDRGISIVYYSELSSCTFSFGLLIFIIIGICSPFQDFSFFDTWFSNSELYSISHDSRLFNAGRIRNVENTGRGHKKCRKSLASRSVWGSLTKVSSILAYLFVINSLFNPARWKRKTGYTLSCENVKKESRFRIESQGCTKTYFSSLSPMNHRL